MSKVDATKLPAKKPAANRIISLESIGDLNEYEVASVDLAGDYWTPTEVGETRRVVFAGFDTREVPDQNNPDQMNELEHAVFAEPSGDGMKQVLNGSKALVGRLKECDVAMGTALQIVYRGKKKGKSGKNYDDWSIFVLQPKGGAK